MMITSGRILPELFEAFEHGQWEFMIYSITSNNKMLISHTEVGND